MAQPVAAPAAAADEGGASSHLLPESSSRIHPARLKAAVRLTDLNAKKDVAHSFRPTQSTVRPNFSPLLLKKINDGLEDADAETAGLERVLHGLKELRAFCRDPEHAGEVLLSGGLVVACKAAQYQNPKVPELSAQVQVQALGLIAKLKRTAEAPGDEAEAAEERWLETMERDWLKAATNQGA